MNIRFPWRMLQGGEAEGLPRGSQNRTIAMSQPDLVPQADFCRRALACGIEPLLLDFGFATPDPIWLASAMGARVESMELFGTHVLPIIRRLEQTRAHRDAS